MKIKILSVKPLKRPKKSNREKLEIKLDKAWSLYVRNRDKFCKKCGSKSATLAPHHAFGRRHMATRWDVMNGISLCYPCHINWAHRDAAGFAVWFESMVGRDQYLRLAEAHNIPTKHTKEDLESMCETFNEMIRKQDA